MTRAELKVKAKLALTGNWGTAIAALLVQILILSVVGAFTTLHFPVPGDFAYGNFDLSFDIGTTVVLGPLTVGMSAIYLTMLRGGKPVISQLFSGFTTCFVAALIAQLITTILCSIAALLLIIPAIILGLMFSQTFYILADHPDLSGIDALKASAAMMKGHKMELFILGLSFFPWLLLCVFVIPLLYVDPYMSATMAAFYEYVSGAEQD